MFLCGRMRPGASLAYVLRKSLERTRSAREGLYAGFKPLSVFHLGALHCLHDQRETDPHERRIAFQVGGEGREPWSAGGPSNTSGSVSLEHFARERKPDWRAAPCRGQLRRTRHEEVDVRNYPTSGSRSCDPSGPPSQRRLAHDGDVPSAWPSAWRYMPPLRDGRVPFWVVGGRRYQIALKLTLGICTDQLKTTPEDWT